jgi:hypothetical protein
MRVLRLALLAAIAGVWKVWWGRAFRRSSGLLLPAPDVANAVG